MNRMILFALTVLVAFATGHINEAGAQFGIALSFAFALRPMLEAMGVNSVRLAGVTADAVSEQLEDLSRKLADAVTGVGKKQTELTELGNDLKSKWVKREALDEENTRKLDEAITATNEQKAAMQEITLKLQEIAQKQESRAKKEGPEIKSYGEQITEAKGYDKFKESGFQGSRKFELKAVTRVGAAGILRDPYESSLVSLEREMPTIRDLLTRIPVASDSIRYAAQTVRTNNAAPVAEGAKKPYSDYKWEKRTATIITLAHLAKLTLQALADAPRLSAEVESELRYGLKYVEEAQLLYGSGVGENINGLMTQAPVFAMPGGITLPANATRIDVIRYAMLQLALAHAPADAAVINPIDWTMIELLKDTTNAYLFANIQGTVDRRLWGLRMVETPSIEVGDFLVGAFKYGAELYDREEMNVLISTENGTDFEDNMATMRCEERVGLGVKRTYAFCKGNFETILP